MSKVAKILNFLPFADLCEKYVMANKYVGNFVFHPVGHGLFYSGIIKNLESKNQFTFIYDCGGNSKNVSYAIDELLEKTKTIDLLIISHFHRDHINGVPKLKDAKKIEIKTVVLPYLDDTSKILYIAALAEDSNKDIQAYTDELRKFILEPENFFGENTKVFFIQEEGNESEPRRNKNDGDKPSNQEEFVFSWTNCNPPKDGKNIIVGNANYVSPIWAFHFFMPKKNPNFFEELKYFFEHNGITCDNAITKWEDIKKQKLNNNISNLVCAHGPTENVIVQTIRNNKFFCLNQLTHLHPYIFYPFEWNIGVQFLTGDAEIDDQTAFSDKYREDLKRSVLFQIPHHGSDKNWHDWFSEYQQFCNLWPVTHDTNDRYGHPSAVFSYIIPYSVTEDKNTKLGIQIYFWHEC